MSKKYDLNKPMEFGRVAFALGLSDTGYSNASREIQALISSGWNLEYKRNKVRMLKREGKKVPRNLQFADAPCINTRTGAIDRKRFYKMARNYGYV